MATTTNYGWTTPDDTSLVKDGASAIRTLGSSIDTTTKALNPSTTLGDIEYRSSTVNTNTRLGIGTSGQVLTVNGSGVPAWTTLAGGAKSWSLLNAGGTALTGSTTVTVSGISGKDDLLVLISYAASTANPTIRVRFNSDSASNYIQGGVALAATSNSANSVIDYTSLVMGSLPNSAAHFTGYVRIGGANSNGMKNFLFAGMGESSSDGNVGAGIYEDTAAITSVSIISGNGNWNSGTVYVYGAA